MISAAHCYCGVIMQCVRYPITYTKANNPEIRRVKVIFGLHGKGKTASRKEPYRLNKLVVHQDYKYNVSESRDFQNVMMDVALLKMTEDVFDYEAGRISTYPSVVPICLPAMLGFVRNKDQREKGIHQPFEDLDCTLINSKMLQVSP